MTPSQFIETYNSLPENLKVEAEHYVEFLSKKIQSENKSKTNDSLKRERGGYGILRDKICMSDDFNAPLDELKDYM